MLADSPGLSDRAWRWMLCGLCAVLLAPFALVDVPPLQDYPNHLARLVVLAAGADDPVLAGFYAPRWRVMPDLGIELLGVPLLAVLPVHVVGRLLAAAALLLPVLGTLACARAMGNRSLWPFAVGLVAYNQTYLLGFLNFSLGLGLALLFAAAWLRWRERFPVASVALGAVAAIVLFACHLMGLLFYALLIGAHEAAMLGFPLRWRDLARRGGAGIAVLAVPLALYAGSELHGTEAPILFLSPVAKLEQALAPVVNYRLSLDVLTGGVLLVLPLVWLLTRVWMPSRAAWVAMAGLLVLYAAAPYGFKGTFSLDTRFIIMFGFVLIASLSPIGLSRRMGALAGGGLTLLFVARMGVLLAAWNGHRADLADLRAAIAPVPAGASVFLTTVSPEEASTYWAAGPASRRLSNGARVDTHMPALLVIERRAWWPLLFDNPSQQPIETRPPWRALAERFGGLDGHTNPGLDPCGFDYLLLLEADAIDPAAYAPDRLTLLRAVGFAALYRVNVIPSCSR